MHIAHTHTRAHTHNLAVHTYAPLFLKGMEGPVCGEVLLTVSLHVEHDPKGGIACDEGYTPLQGGWEAWFTEGLVSMEASTKGAITGINSLNIYCSSASNLCSAAYIQYIT